MSHFRFAGFIGIVAISRIFFPSCQYLFFVVFGRDVKSNKCSEYSYIGLGDFLVCVFFFRKKSHNLFTLGSHFFFGLTFCFLFKFTSLFS